MMNDLLNTPRVTASPRPLVRAAFLMLLAFASVATAQDTIEIDTEVVNISVSVRDGKGNFVEKLKKEDFELLDNNKIRDIEFFSDEAAPVSYGIVYDLHPTTSAETKNILRSLRAFTVGLPEKDDFFVVVFNEYGSLNINFVPTEEQISRHLSFGDRSEPNSLYDAVYSAGEKLKTRENQKRALIIISDGKDHQSHHSYSALERLLKSFDVQIFAVILDKTDRWDYSGLSLPDRPKRLNIDESELKKAALTALSIESGGISETAETNSLITLYSAFERIAIETRGGYSLGFYPGDGAEHKIKIKLKTPKKHKLSYRKSFTKNVKNE